VINRRARVVLECLIEGRLLTVQRTEGAVDTEVHIAHEKLLQGWPRLRGWLAEHREAELARRRLEVAVREWRDRRRGLLGEVGMANAQADVARCQMGEVGVPEEVKKWVQASHRRLMLNRRLRWSKRARAFRSVIGSQRLAS
jgi:hypothetical protein